MMKRRTKLAIAAVATAVVALGSPIFLAPADAGPGDVVANPGNFVLVMDQPGSFFNLVGRNTALPDTSTPVECNNGTNDDIAVDDNTKQQDANIDFDGGASHGVSPATPVDAQCNAGSGHTAAEDDSEVKGGFQPRTYVTISGSVDQDGNITVPQANLVFPPVYVYSSQANGVIDVTFTATGDVTGTADPLTGEVNLTVPLRLQVVQAFFGINCISDFTVDVTSGNDPAKVGGPIPVNTAPYDSSGSVTVANNLFTIPAMIPNPAGTTAPTLCNLVGGGFGLPAPTDVPNTSAPGSSAAQFVARSDLGGGREVFTSGLVPAIQGTATDAETTAPAAGVVVTLLGDYPSWSIIDTTITDPNGHFEFLNIPVGTYRVRFFDPNSNHKRVWYGGSSTYKSATPITVESDSLFDASTALPDKPTGAVSGQALGWDGGSSSYVPVTGVKVLVFNADLNEYVAGTMTGSGGYYTVGSLDPGNYKVWFVPPSGSGYKTQWYKFKWLGFNADPVVVGTDQAWASALLGTI